MKWFLDLAGFSQKQIDDLLRLSQQLDIYPEPNALSGGDILDGPRSLVIPNARNRMLVQMAVLYRMLKNL